MALIVEDGTGLEDADSYVSVADFKAYCDARGTSYAGKTDEQIEQALRRATSYIDAVYGGQFLGTPRRFRSQALQWPRVDGYDTNAGEYIDFESVPREVEAATNEATIRELASPGALNPDLKRGGAIKSVKAGSVAVEYMTNAPAETTYSAIERLIAPVLSAGATGGLVGRSVRG
jgi:hypothetical protein